MDGLIEYSHLHFKAKEEASERFLFFKGVDMIILVQYNATHSIKPPINIIVVKLIFSAGVKKIPGHFT